MKYRDAKLLHNGDEVIRKKDKAPMIVKEIEIYGQYKKVRLTCVCFDSTEVVFNDEIE